MSTSFNLLTQFFKQRIQEHVLYIQWKNQYKILTNNSSVKTTNNKGYATRRTLTIQQNKYEMSPASFFLKVVSHNQITSVMITRERKWPHSHSTLSGKSRESAVLRSLLWSLINICTNGHGLTMSMKLVFCINVKHHHLILKMIWTCTVKYNTIICIINIH